jgi:hypothetical protein
MKIMKPFLLLPAIFFCLLANTVTAQQSINVAPFKKVIVSPHIKVKFIQGEEERVQIETSSVSKEKINVEVKGKTLRLYLDDAKTVTKNETVYRNGYKRKDPIYKGTVVTATVTYKDLQVLSLRGEESFLVESPLRKENFRVKLYGETQLDLPEVQLEKLKVTIYGESQLNIASGAIDDFKCTTYGASEINASEVVTHTTRITSYGESEFNVNASDKIKITSFGEATVHYAGNPKIKKGINMGGLKIRKNK